MARVLVCDDERHILRLIEVNLQRQGYEVQWTTDHRVVLDTLRAERFDMLVIDSDYTDPTTAEIEAEIAGDPELAGVRVMVLNLKLGPPGGFDWPNTGLPPAVRPIELS